MGQAAVLRKVCADAEVRRATAAMALTNMVVTSSSGWSGCHPLDALFNSFWSTVLGHDESEYRVLCPEGI